MPVRRCLLVVVLTAAAHVDAMTTIRSMAIKPDHAEIGASVGLATADARGFAPSDLVDASAALTGAAQATTTASVATDAAVAATLPSSSSRIATNAVTATAITALTPTSLSQTGGDTLALDYAIAPGLMDTVKGKVVPNDARMRVIVSHHKAGSEMGLRVALRVNDAWEAERHAGNHANISVDRVGLSVTGEAKISSGPCQDPSGTRLSRIDWIDQPHLHVLHIGRNAFEMVASEYAYDLSAAEPVWMNESVPCDTSAYARRVAAARCWQDPMRFCTAINAVAAAAAPGGELSGTLPAPRAPISYVDYLHSMTEDQGLLATAVLMRHVSLDQMCDRPPSPPASRADCRGGVLARGPPPVLCSTTHASMDRVVRRVGAGATHAGRSSHAATALRAPLLVRASSTTHHMPSACALGAICSRRPSLCRPARARCSPRQPPPLAPIFQTAARYPITRRTTVCLRLVACSGCNNSTKRTCMATCRVCSMQSHVR
jgi:hypothetical protein